MPNTARLKTTLEFLKDNQGFKIENLYLSCKNNVIRVNGFTNYGSTEFMNKKIALEELQNVKDEFCDLKTSLAEFKDFVADKQIIYSLSLDDGKGAFGICEELNNFLKWIVEIPD